MKYLAAKWAAEVAHRLGATKILGDLPRPGGCVVTMHSIVPDADHLPRTHNHVSQRFLDQLLAYYRSIDVPIVSIADGLELTRKDPKAPWIAFTFDDGYRDNVQLGLPIFRKHAAPMTVFVTSAALDRTMDVYWWGQLRHAVQSNDVLSGDEIGGTLNASSAAEKTAAYNAIADRIQRGELSVQDAEAFFEKNGVSREEALDRDCLTADELAAVDLGQHQLTIGGHSSSHTRLARLDAAEVGRDVAANRERLATLTGEEVRYFAYPFGDESACGEREFDIVEELGFAAAFTTRDGNIDRATTERMWALPRRKVIGPVESIGFLECQRSRLTELVGRRASH